MLSCNTVFCIIFSLLNALPFFRTLVHIFLLTVCIIVINGITAALCRALPQKCADPKTRCYRVSAREMRFYGQIRIRRWKDSIPELGHLTGIRKNKLARPDDKEYILRFITECCYGQLCHGFSIITVIPLLLFVPCVAVSIYAFMLNGILNFLPIAVLRYNSHKLLKIVQRLN